MSSQPQSLKFLEYYISDDILYYILHAKGISVFEYVYLKILCPGICLIKEFKLIFAAFFISNYIEIPNLKITHTVSVWERAEIRLVDTNCIMHLRLSLLLLIFKVDTLVHVWSSKYRAFNRTATTLCPIVIKLRYVRMRVYFFIRFQ